jgi:Uma2 family endonuclease
MQHAKIALWSEAGYLEAECHASVRHEYVAGQIFAMAGGSKAHNIIALNLATRLRAHLRGWPCRTYMADMKVRLEKSQAYYYPDVVVSCHAADTARNGPSDYLTAPGLIVEVLSASTETIDRREKRLAYMQLPSLREYVLIDSQTRRIEIYRKNEQGEITLDIPAEGEIFSLDSVSLTLAFADVYEDADVD